MAVQNDIGDILQLQSVGVAVRFIGEPGRTKLIVSIGDRDCNDVDAPLADCQHLFVAVVREQHVTCLEMLQTTLVFHDAWASQPIGPLFHMRHMTIGHISPHRMSLADHVRRPRGQFAHQFALTGDPGKNFQNALVILVHEQLRMPKRVLGVPL